MDKKIEIALHDATLRLRSAGIATPALDARLLLQSCLKITQEELLKNSLRLLTDDEQKSFDTLIHRRLKGEPVSRILGHREFWGMTFQLNEYTLDPRPDSETLIEACLDLIPDKKAPLRILDLGTGTGCLLIALLSELENASGIGVDIQAGAIQMASQNAKNLGYDKRSQWIVDSWGQSLSEPFDLIISNPPYIPANEIPGLATEVKDFDPFMALAGGVQGLDAYQNMASHCARLLAKNGLLVIEIGATTPHPAPLFAEHDLILINSRKDLGQVLRCLIFKHGSIDSDEITVAKTP